MAATFWSTVTGVVAGAVVTSLVAQHFYKRTAADLFARVMKLLQALEEAGLVELARDRSGKPTGGIVKEGQVKVTI